MNSIQDSELFDSGYMVWRRDRDYELTKQATGGGVLLAAHRDLSVIPRPEWNSTAEDIWISIKVPTQHRDSNYLHIGVLYLCKQNKGLSFTQQLNNFFTKLNEIMLLYPLDKFLVLGDFNMSRIQWNAACNVAYLSPSNAIRQVEYKLLDELSACNLSQYNNILNKYGKILDLVVCTDDVEVSNCDFPLVPLDPHHKALHVNLDLSSYKPLKCAQRIMHCYHKANYEAILEDLSNIVWEREFSSDSIERCVKKFYDILYHLRDRYVPIKKLTDSDKFPAWFSPALKKVLKEKHKFLKKYKKYKMKCDESTIKLLSKRAKTLEAECYRNYIAQVEGSILDNPKYFWSHMKNLSSTKSIPSNMTFNNITTNSGDEICNLFAAYFQSMFLTPDKNSHYPQSYGEGSSVCDIFSIDITVEDVRRELRGLDITKSAGPDEIPPSFLVRCSEQLANPLSILFSKSISEGYVPVIWKAAFISPIHKKGPKNLVPNYRPISKLCIISKTFEKIVYKQVYAALRQSFSLSQHGFLKGRSTVTNLLILNDQLTDNMENRLQTDVIYTDYSKAFDRVDHKLLLLKLQLAGIRGDLLRWFSSYIDNRSQAVVVSNFISDWNKVPSGVPQGSLLGPLLFVIFISDIDSCFHHSKVLSFADDMKIYKPIRSIADAEALQADLKRLDNYCIQNKLDLNPSKCFYVTFSRKKQNIHFNYSLKDHNLQTADKIRDLGVIHDSKLLFDSHVDNIVQRASRSLGFIMRSSKDFKNAKTLKILYCTYVRSSLEYASQVWNPRYNIYIKRIEAIQKKFIRFLNYRVKSNVREYLASCRRMHLLPLYKRREIADSLLLIKIVRGDIDCPELLTKLNFYIPNRSRRSPPTFSIPNVSTNYRQNTYMWRACDTFNKLAPEHLDIDIFHSSIPSARRKLSNMFFKP